MIIGFTGKLGSGKSTAAQLMAAKFPFRRVIPMAAKIKEIATIMGWDGVKDEKGRKLLQLLGTECGRECIGENVWVDMWLKEYSQWEKTISSAVDFTRNNYTYGDICCICDDIRFDNEAKAIRGQDGIIIQIASREGEATQQAATHASEKGVSKNLIHKVINNSGTLDSLIGQINTIYKEIMDGNLR